MPGQGTSACGFRGGGSGIRWASAPALPPAHVTRRTWPRLRLSTAVGPAPLPEPGILALHRRHPLNLQPDQMGSVRTLPMSGKDMGATPPHVGPRNGLQWEGAGVGGRGGEGQSAERKGGRTGPFPAPGGAAPSVSVLSPRSPSLMHLSSQALRSLFLLEGVKPRPQLTPTGHGWHAGPFPNADLVLTARWALLLSFTGETTEAPGGTWHEGQRKGGHESTHHTKTDTPSA